MKVLIPLPRQPKIIRVLIQNESGVQIKMMFETPMIIKIFKGDNWNGYEIEEILDLVQDDDKIWCLECEVI